LYNNNNNSKCGHANYVTIPVPRITSVGYNLSPSGRKSGFSKSSYTNRTKHMFTGMITDHRYSR